MSYPLRVTKNRIARPGDFAATLEQSAVEVPEEVSVAARKLSLRDAGELISYLYSFPSAFASELGWNIDEVASARDRLANQMHGLLPDAILSPPTPVKRSYGAFPPSWKDSSNG